MRANVHLRHLLASATLAVLAPAALLLSTACNDALGHGPAGVVGSRFDEPDVEIDLTAGAFDWEVYDGETVEAWGFNQQYPGPEIRVKQGQKVRVNVTNNLDEPTAIHFHGLDVPNDQDGVPNITQPAIQPGETWTYEFVAERAGTTVYHTHANTPTQLGRGMFGMFVVEPKEKLPYDREYTLLLHEIDGLYTVNGHAFPATLDSDLMSIREGERALIRMANMGSQHHPMHLHGHQFLVVSIDGNRMPPDWRQNTIDIAPGQTVDVVVEGTNPGTWVFHCHIIPHVTNRGEYPGGMLVVLDYEDHTSYFEEQAARPASPAPSPQPTSAATTGPAAGEVTLVSSDAFRFEPDELTVTEGEAVRVVLDNTSSGQVHDFTIDAIPADDIVADGRDFGAAGAQVHVAAGPGEAVSVRLTPTASGEYVFYCSVPGHREAGMQGILRVQPP